MLNYEIAKKVYEEIKEKAAKILDENLQNFYRDFLKNAVEYAQKRTEWTFMDPVARCDDDRNRSRIHDAFMTRLLSVCRNLGIEGIEETMPDRKTKGDFACYIALFLSLEQR